MGKVEISNFVLKMALICILFSSAELLIPIAIHKHFSSIDPKAFFFCCCSLIVYHNSVSGDTLLSYQLKIILLIYSYRSRNTAIQNGRTIAILKYQLLITALRQHLDCMTWHYKTVILTELRKRLGRIRESEVVDGTVYLRKREKKCAFSKKCNKVNAI